MFVGMICVGSVSGQITNIVATDDSSFVLERVYAGALEINSFSVDSLDHKGTVILRVGAAARLQLAKGLSLRTFFAQGSNSDGKGPTIANIFFRYEPGKRWRFLFGRGPQAGTFLHSPHPVSAEGQFETFSQSRIPPAAIGCLAMVTLGKTEWFASTGFNRSSREYHLGLRVSKVSVSSWYNDSGRYGTAMTCKLDKTTIVLVVRDDVLAGTLIQKLSKRFVAYADVGVSSPMLGLVRSEAGLLRPFKTSYYVKGLVGIGYAHELRAVRAYLYITL